MFPAESKVFCRGQQHVPEAALDLFLHATRAGLLEFRFNLICPGCGGVEYQMKSMDRVPTKQWYCVVCARDVEADLDDRVEVSFTVEVGVRALDFHAFDTVDNYMRFYFSRNFLGTGAAELCGHHLQGHVDGPAGQGRDGHHPG